MSAYDSKLAEFVNLLDLSIYRLSSSDMDFEDVLTALSPNSDHEPLKEHFSSIIDQLEAQIVTGVRNDFDFNQGLDALLKLINDFPKIMSTHSTVDDSSSTLLNCIRLRKLVHRWLSFAGLVYSTSYSVSDLKLVKTVEHLINFRNNVRKTAIDSMKALRNASSMDKDTVSSLADNMGQLLKECDDTRSFLSEQNIKLKVSFSKTCKTCCLINVSFPGPIY